MFTLLGVVLTSHPKRVTVGRSRPLPIVDAIQRAHRRHPHPRKWRCLADRAGERKAEWNCVYRGPLTGIAELVPKVSLELFRNRVPGHRPTDVVREPGHDIGI
jgi:hypothetical protein